ncbi:class I tRNA ligase family protein, partial [Campylobacter coli]|nr:class I tRNA ligase family protein [Campylobacter coli]
TKFYPQSGVKRIGSMVENRPDWCISRQRDWGTPIAFFRDKNTKEVIFDAELFDFVANIFEKHGADAWWEFEIKDLIPQNSKYNADNLEKVYDILDVWFDSGSTWNAVLNSGIYDAGEKRASMYLEGSDQHRGWFQSSLLAGTAINEFAPYESILTHGFTTDEKGQKMSKSKGNVIAPEYVAKTYGVEILRLWILLSDYSTDLKISDNILKQVGEQYRKIRNTIRFLLANTNDLENLEVEEFSFIDKWILTRATRVFKSAKENFLAYEFAKGFNVLLNFLSADLSGIYLDISKDRLYCDAKNSKRRKSAQVAMALIARELLNLLAPNLTYSVDEALEHANSLIKGDAKDVFDLSLEEKFEYDFNIDDEFLLSVREKFFENIDILKKDKVIKSTLELNLDTNSKLLNSIPKDELNDWFMVSFDENLQGEVLCEFEVENESFRIMKATLCKCPRCWKVESAKEDEPCMRCAEVLKHA